MRAWVFMSVPVSDPSGLREQARGSKRGSSGQKERPLSNGKRTSKDNILRALFPKKPTFTKQNHYFSKKNQLLSKTIVFHRNTKFY